MREFWASTHRRYPHELLLNRYLLLVMLLILPYLLGAVQLHLMDQNILLTVMYMVATVLV